MWLGLFSAPSARSRLAETVAAAKSSALDELYGRVFPCTVLERLLKQQIPPHKTRNIFKTRKSVRRVNEVYVLEEWTRWTENEAHCAKLIY